MKNARTTKPTITTLADGRIMASLPQADGPKVAEYPVPGVAGELLNDLGYDAHITIRRVDGGAITEGDRARLDPMLKDVAELGTHSPEVHGRAATRHFAKAKRRLEARSATKRTG